MALLVHFSLAKQSKVCARREKGCYNLNVRALILLSRNQGLPELDQMRDARQLRVASTASWCGTAGHSALPWEVLLGLDPAVCL